MSRPGVSPSAALFRATRRASAVLAAAFLVALGLLGWASSRIRLEQDVSRFFPEGSDAAVSTELLEAFHTVDQLLVTLDAGERGLDALVAAGDRVGAALEASGLFSRVTWRLGPQEQLRLWEAYFPARFGLLSPAEVDRLLSPEGVRDAIARASGELMSPQSSFREEAVVRDPLGVGAAALRRAVEGSSAYRVETERNRFVSADRRHLLVVATVARSAMEVDAAEQALAVVRAAEAELRSDPLTAGVSLDVLGGPVWSWESARTLKHDIAVASAATTVGLLLVFLLAFRNVRTLLLMQAAGAFGVGVAAVSLAAAQGGVSGITLGFGAAVLGLSADYSLHLLTHASVLEDGRPRDEAIERTLRDLDGSIGIGWLTTLVSFAVLLLSRAGGLRDIALFSGLGITAAWFACMAFLPHLHRVFGARKAAPIRGSALASGLARLGEAVMAYPRASVAAVVALTAAFAVVAPGARFNGDSRDLLYEPPEVKAAEARFEGVFGGQGASAMVVVEGRDTEEALARAERVREVLDGARRDGAVASVLGVTGMVPSAEAQARNLRAWTSRDPEAVIAAVRDEGARQGFTPDAFEPFFTELRGLSAGEPAVLKLEDLRGTALAGQVERSVATEPGRARILSLVILPAASDRASDADTAFPSAVEAHLRAAEPGVVVVSRVATAARAVRQVKDEAARLMGWCLLTTVVVLLAYYRSLLPMFLALAPPLAALVWTFGAMSLLGLPLNIVSICALVLIVGVGIDYGIYVVDACLREGVDRLPDVLRSTGTAVVLSSLSTITGFGTMALAKNPSLSTVGIEVVLGITASIVTALVWVPAALHLGRRRRGGAGIAAAGLLVLSPALVLSGCAPGRSGTVADGPAAGIGGAGVPVSEARALPAVAQLVHQVEMKLGPRTFVFDGYTLLVDGKGLVFLGSTPLGVDLFQLTRSGARSRIEVLFAPLRRSFRGEPLLDDLVLALAFRCPPIGAGPEAVVPSACEDGDGQVEIVTGPGGAWVEKRRTDRRGRLVTRVTLARPLDEQPLVARDVRIESRRHRHRLRLALQDARFDVPFDAGLFEVSEADAP